MKRKKKTELKHNTVTTIYLVFVLVALVVLVVSFFDIPFMEKTNEILTELDFSTQLQIINTIMCCTISILGIAFTVQDRKRFGVRITTYYGMRRNGFFNFKKNIKVSISLMAIGMFALAANKNVPLLLISIYIILLCIASLKIEIPFLEADEKTLVNCLRRELIKELSSETDLDSFNSININYAIAGLLIEKNLDETYKNLCTDDTEKNKELLLKLLDIQSENKYFVESFNSKSETIKAAESISNSIQSILGGGFDLVGVVGEDLNKFLFPILKLIYRGLENTESQDKIKHIISEYSMQMFETKNEELDTLKFNVVTYVIINEIKSNKLDIIKEYRKNLSTNLFFYKNNHYTTRVFMMISFVIYYLTEIEKDFDEEIKENILQFINDSGRERDFKIESWKTIFKKFTESMNYSIDDFLDDFNTNKNRYEYWYYDNNAKCECFDNQLAIDWYIANFLNSKSIITYDYTIKFKNSKYDYVKNRLKQLQTHLLSEDREKLDVSQEFKSIASFYLDKDANFLYAETLEKGHHYIKNCIDLFIDDEIDKNKKAANEIETQDVEIEIKKLLKEKLADIYGYSQEITLKDLKDYNFNIIEERYANIKGFESFYAESILGAVCHVIYVNDIQPNNLKADEIERVVTSTREYTNVLAINNSKYLLENIKNNEIKKVITQKIDNIEGYFNKKTLFKTPTIIFNDDFKFNCDVDVVIKELSPDQINLKINEHLRKDGQYEFNGKFYSREELYETIKELMRCICVSFKYRTVFKKDNVLTFNY